MATKKTTPVKKQVKPATKATAKAAPSKKVAVKKAASTKAAPAKTVKAAAAPKKTATKAAPAKAAPKKATPAKKTPATKAATVKKTAPAKTTPVKAKAAPPKATPVAAPKKTAAKASTRKEQSTKKPVVPRLSTKSSVKYQPDFTKSILDTPKKEAVKAVVRYSDNDLQEFKEIILRKLDAAKKELNYLQGLITRRDEGGDMDEGRYMTMEDGSVSMEREQLSQLASRQITFIDHLEKALMRVENKTYGICRVTGNLIDKARLRAVPHATLSMEAKSMMNK